MTTISIANDFSRYPAGRYESDGPFSGEAFRRILVEKLIECRQVTVAMDGTLGYGSGFLEEAFGGLVRVCGFCAEDLPDRLHISSIYPGLLMEVWSYIEQAR